ncbi:hypothetical protein [Nocardioides sp. MH1]|uniref:hypothetical protein n=1 Tax=Nocardioides sp. MH1 TaxID=3242490 RepID=UPI0035225D7D
MHHRRSTATALVAVLLPLAATLTSCGFDAPTDRVNTIAAGVNNRDNQVDVLGARVVAWSDGQGRLIGSLVYNDNDADKPAQLTKVTGADLSHDVTVSDIEVAQGEGINLAGDDVTPIALEGDFTAGDVIPLVLTFSTGESAAVDVPVVKPCRQYSEIIAPEFEVAAGSESASPSADATAESDSAESETDDTYLCDHPTPSPEGEE